MVSRSTPEFERRITKPRRCCIPVQEAISYRHLTCLEGHFWWLIHSILTAGVVSFIPTGAQVPRRYRPLRRCRMMFAPDGIAGFFNFERHTMNSNQKSGNKQSGTQGGVQGGTPEQHAEAGRQSHKNDANRQSGSAGSATGGSTAGGASGGRSVSSGSASGMRGGTPEQHAEAGRQSHKNDGKK